MPYYIREWDCLVHYPSRNAPWVKLYKNVLHAPWWIRSSPTTKLVAITLLVTAEQSTGRVLVEPRDVKLLAQLKKEPDFKQLIDYLQVVTSAGGLAGGLAAQTFSDRTLDLHFAAVTAVVAAVMLSRLERRNVICDLSVEPGRLGGRFFDQESGGDVVYRLKRLPLALGIAWVAGSVSGLLGIGGGILIVPALHAWCGVPLRAAAATSAFMIGVTAVSAAPVYYAECKILLPVAAAAVLGVVGGSYVGLVRRRVRAKWLKLLMAVVLFGVSILTLVRTR